MSNQAIQTNQSASDASLIAQIEQNNARMQALISEVDELISNLPKVEQANGATSGKSTHNLASNRHPSSIAHTILTCFDTDSGSYDRAAKIRADLTAFRERTVAEYEATKQFLERIRAIPGAERESRSLQEYFAQMQIHDNELPEALTGSGDEQETRANDGREDGSRSENQH